MKFADLPQNVKYLLRCAVADLEGAEQAYNHDWKAHSETIAELEQFIGE